MYEARRLLLKLDKEEMPDVSKTGRRIDPPITSSMQGRCHLNPPPPQVQFPVSTCSCYV